MAAANKTVWGIHTMDDPLFLNQNLIAIGWEGMGNLSSIIASRDAYKEKYSAVYPDANCQGLFYQIQKEVTFCAPPRGAGAEFCPARFLLPSR